MVLASPNEPLGSISLGAYTDPSCHNLAFTLGVDNNVNVGNGPHHRDDHPSGTGHLLRQRLFRRQRRVQHQRQQWFLPADPGRQPGPSHHVGKHHHLHRREERLIFGHGDRVPTPSLSEIGALPGGVTFTDNHNGTATLAGTPKPLTVGTYSSPSRRTTG